MNAPEQIVEEQTRLTLNDGNTIPQFGFGTYMIEGDVETEKVCSEALSLGYRHIDTAHAYQNERGVGRRCARAAYRARMCGSRASSGRASTAKA